MNSIREFPLLEGVENVSSNPLESLIVGGWKPQLAVVGMDSIPAIKDAGNVNLPSIAAKLSIRIPPTKNVKEAEKIIMKTLT